MKAPAVNIFSGSALTAPDTADVAVLYDTYAAANRTITLGDLLKVISTLPQQSNAATDDSLVLGVVALGGGTVSTVVGGGVTCGGGSGAVTVLGLRKKGLAFTADLLR